ncbi:hypothetical protein D3C86_1795790 [compost metagenome]
MFTFPFSFFDMAPSYTRLKGFCLYLFWLDCASATSVATIDVAMAMIDVSFFIFFILLFVMEYLVQNVLRSFCFLFTNCCADNMYKLL